MDEITSCCARLSSSKHKDRHDALRALQRLFENPTRICGLKDKVFGKIISSLFVLIGRETQRHLHSKATYDAEDSVLSSCGSLLRKIVQTGLPVIRASTVRTIVRSIIEILPYGSHSTDDPLLYHCLRCLRLILQVGSHLEHLSQDDWLAVAKFCIINLQVRFGLEMDSDLTSYDLYDIHVDSKSDGRIDMDSVELMACLKCLVESSSANLFSICDVPRILVYFFSLYPEESHAHVHAFAMANIFLNFASVNDLNLASSFSMLIICFALRVLRTNSDSLQEHILIALTHSASILSMAMQSQDKINHLNHINIVAFVKEFVSEMSESSIRENLRIEWLDLGVAPNDQRIMRLKCTALSIHTAASESMWAKVWIAAQFIIIADMMSMVSSRADIDNRSKKRKHCSLFEEILSNLTEGNSQQKVIGIQLLVFILYLSSESNHGYYTEPFLNLHLISRIQLLLQSKDEQLSSWALLFFAELSQHIELRMHVEWNKIWTVTLSCIHQFGTCKAACCLTHLILQNELLAFESISDDINGLLTSIELRGPALLCNSSIQMLIAMLNKSRNNANYSQSRIQIICWLSSKWKSDLISLAFSKAEVLSYSSSNLLDLLFSLHGIGDLCFPIKNDISHLSICLTLTRIKKQTPLQTVLNSSVWNGIIASKAGSRITTTTEVLFDRYYFLRPVGLYLQIDETLKQLYSMITHELSSLANVFRIEHCCKVVRIAIMFTILSSILHYSFPEHQSESLCNNIMQLILNIPLSEDCARTLLDLVLSEISPLLSIKFGTQRPILQPLVSACRLEPIINLLQQNIFCIRRKQAHENVEFSENIALDSFHEDEIIVTNYPRDANGFKNHGNCIRNISCGSVLFSFDENASSNPHQYLFKRPMDDRICFMLNYIKTLPVSDGIWYGPLLEFITSKYNHILTDGHCILIVRILGQLYLQQYCTQFCQPFIIICIKVLVNLFGRWFNSTSPELHEDCQSVYDWIIHKLFTSRLSSTEEKIAIIPLVALLIKNNHVDSVIETSLDNTVSALLYDSNKLVRFESRLVCTSLFHKRNGVDHLTLFHSITQTFGQEVQLKETVTIQIVYFVFIGLASYPTKMQAVYELCKFAQHSQHLFTCTSALSYMTTQLNFKESRLFFDFYHKKIICMWLNNGNKINCFPYQLFQLDFKENWLSQYSGEIISQMLMMKLYERSTDFCIQLHLTLNDKVKNWFHIAFPYCICSDILSGDLEWNASKECKKLVGSMFVNLLRDDLVAIMATLFSSVYIGKEALKSLQLRNISTQFSLEESICDEVHEFVGLTEPHFPLTVIVKSIEYIETCSDGQFAWNEATFLYVSRILLQYANCCDEYELCGKLFKFKAFLGHTKDVWIRGYPIEMTLHSLGMLLSHKRCSIELYGIFHYVMQSCLLYTKENPFTLVNAVFSVYACLQEISSQNIVSQDVLDSSLIWLSDYLLSILKEIDTTTTAKKGLRKITEYLSLRIKNLHASADWWLDEDVLFCLFIPINRNTLFAYTRNIIGQLINDDLKSMPLDISCKKISWGNIPEYLIGITRSLSLEHNLSQCIARILGNQYFNEGPKIFKSCHEMNLVWSRPDALQGLIKNEKYKILERVEEQLYSDDYLSVTAAEHVLQQLKYNSIDICLNTVFSNVFTLAEKTIPALPAEQNINNSINISDEDMLNFSIPAKHWLIGFAKYTCKVSNDEFLHYLQNIVCQDIDLFVQLSPYIINICVLELYKNNKHDILTMLANFINHIFTQQNDAAIDISKVLIRILLYLKCQCGHLESGISLLCDNIDFIKAITFASRNGYPRSALLLFELSTSIGKGDTSDILYNIYLDINESDFSYGMPFKASLDNVIQRYEFEGRLMQSLVLRSASLEVDCVNRENQKINEVGLHRTLHEMGLDILSHGLKKEYSISSSLASKLAYRLQQWELPRFITFENANEAIFEVLRYQSIIHEASPIDPFIAPFDYLLQGLKHENFSQNTLNTSLQSLATLLEIEKVSTSHIPKDSLTFFDLYNTFIPEWMHTGSFRDFEDILIARDLSLDIQLKARRNRSNADTPLFLLRCLSSASLCRISRQNDRLQIALKAALVLYKYKIDTEQSSIQTIAAMMFADVLWDQGDRFSSIHLLKHAISTYSTSDEQISFAELLAHTGHCLSLLRGEHPDDILKTYLEPAADACSGKLHPLITSKVLHIYAEFCDDQLRNEANLEDFYRSQKLKDQKQVEVDQISSLITEIEISSSNQSSKQLKDLKILLSKASQQLKSDEKDYNRLYNTRQTFLCKAIENYLKSVAASDIYEEDVLRFTCLWMANCNVAELNAIVEQNLSEIPSYKFIGLLSQFCSRLADIKTPFQDQLVSLIGRICIEHPFHGMYHLYPMQQADKSSDAASLSRRKAALNIERKAANAKEFHELYSKFKKLCGAYDGLAQYQLSRKETGPGNIPLAAYPSHRLFSKDIPRLGIPSPTLDICIRKDLDYRDVPRITGFSKHMRIASGLSAPKIIECVTESGTVRQLVKGGNDDLRQDAIMEQVFAKVSRLLRKSHETRRRQLKLRTYKVIPLSRRSGILEFVPNSISYNDYLIKAHERNFPKDWPHIQCRKAVQGATTKSKDERLQVFTQVTLHTHPAMRFFFFERFLGPDEWFMSRLAYSRTTAAISMLGHVLGLGDRHGQNILLDAVTGEVVHIDLGISFEQGKVLPIPETVPFRLTRDVIDGFGITGVEGVFRKCCELTLKVLRDESINVLTLLDVLRFDPLHSWALSPLRKLKMQSTQLSDTAARSAELFEKGSSVETAEADRAILVVTQKLSQSLSVEATVSELIRQATDVNNLAVLFSGWSAWM